MFILLRCLCIIYLNDMFWPFHGLQVHVKSMLIIFFNIQGIVYKESVPPGQTINAKFYCKVLKQLREDIQCKHPDKWKKNKWFLHHDNVPANTSLVVQQFLTSKNITVIPPPMQLFPIPQDEITVERVSFWHDWGDPHRNTRGYRHTHIWELPGMHEIWETCWDHCIHAQGGYFEGDGGN